MQTIIDDRLRAEAELYHLRFVCEHCAHFCEDSQRCSGGYPAEPHLRVELSSADWLEFCKQFELR
jgi:hypothetical protein